MKKFPIFVHLAKDLGEKPSTLKLWTAIKKVWSNLKKIASYRFKFKPRATKWRLVCYPSSYSFLKNFGSFFGPFYPENHGFLRITPRIFIRFWKTWWRFVPHANAHLSMSIKKIMSADPQNGAKITYPVFLKTRIFKNCLLDRVDNLYTSTFYLSQFFKIMSVDIVI